MKTAQEILESLIGDTVYITTRGTMGDADGMSNVDDELVAEFTNGTVIKLSDSNAFATDYNHSRAYDDIIDELNNYIDDQAKLNNYDGYYVIYKDNQYLLTWV